MGFKEDQRDALLSLDKEKIIKYSQKYGAEFNPSDDLVFWAAVHKARIFLYTIPESEKEISRAWLRKYGFKAIITGITP